MYDRNIEKVTPKTLPAIRQFVSRTLLDVFYFMSPTFSEVIYREVVVQLNEAYNHFRLTHANFSGKVSVSLDHKLTRLTHKILAHSLGSMICFDLLTRNSCLNTPPLNPTESNIFHWKAQATAK
jgi:hypothetical protein